MVMKKDRERAAKRKIEQEDLIREQKIQVAIEEERAIADEKKRQGANQIDGSRVRFSPVVKTRAEKKAMGASPKG